MPIPEPAQLFNDTEKALGPRYRLERILAASEERVMFLAIDRMLDRRVTLRVSFTPTDQYQEWFLEESRALAQLNHPAIRHVYDAGIHPGLVFRSGNWIEGEGLHGAVARGPRPIPAVHALARDVLGALEHAHSRGIVVRRITPTSVLVSGGGRGTLTDLRFCSRVLPTVPIGLGMDEESFMAPEIRNGSSGDPASDVFTAAAIIYFALTAVVPPSDLRAIVPPRQIRPTTPLLVEQILLRALDPDPFRRFMSAAEMLESFASVAGSFDTPGLNETQVTSLPGKEAASDWERRLRRALGDDYELLGALGAGGFGRVYEVRDLHLERLVALKVLHPLLTQDPAVVERFRREAQLAARLNHPHIVNIYDIGGRSGLIWYTMERVDGPNLAQRVERDGPMPLDRVLRILREGLDALRQAHHAGLVHRDIKPENMLLERRDGSLRITDFGLALALLGHGKWGGATSQSGTPQFASPEQLLGERVDQRSDLYSIAAVALFALIGAPPFSGQTPEQVLAKQTTDYFPNLEEIRADVGPELIQVLRKATRSDREERYNNATEFLDALELAVGRDQERRKPAWVRRLLGLNPKNSRY